MEFVNEHNKDKTNYYYACICFMLDGVEFDNLPLNEMQKNKLEILYEKMRKND